MYFPAEEMVQESFEQLHMMISCKCNVFNTNGVFLYEASVSGEIVTDWSLSDLATKITPSGISTYMSPPNERTTLALETSVFCTFVSTIERIRSSREFTYSFKREFSILREATLFSNSSMRFGPSLALVSRCSTVDICCRNVSNMDSMLSIQDSISVRCIFYLNLKFQPLKQTMVYNSAQYSSIR